ncbi:MAG TPA: TonB-dependent receptor [Rudaea sp.]|nr:TonB-dependent receptor [Rudaea sp.]
MLKPNLLAIAVVSVLASSAFAAKAVAADTNGTPYAQNSAPASPDGSGDAQDVPANVGQAAGQEENKSTRKAGDEATVNLGEIQVTGVRAAIEEAISVKQNSNEIVETISAEDIGKLPDNSIAESLARLPGLAAQRIGGRASTVSLRGFSGDFSGTLLNGREQVSTGDNRAVEFDQYPSELISGVVVYKTPEASLIGQGIAGTIDLQTVRPLDFSKRVVNVGARGEWLSQDTVNAGTDDNGYRVNAAYIDQYFDHTLGLAVAYARLKSPVQDQRFESWGYTTVNVPAGTPGLAEGGSVQALGGAKVYPTSTEGTRDAFMGTLEWRPNEKFTSTLDLYWSKFKQETTWGGFEVGLPWGSNTVLTDPVVQNGDLVAGTWSNLKPVIRHELDHHDDEIKSFGWNNKLRFGDGWQIAGDLSWAKATTDQSFLEEYAGTVPGTPGSTDTWSFTNDQHGVPQFSNLGLNYTDPNIIKLVDSGGWGQDGYLKFPKVTDELKAARVDLSKDLGGPLSKVDVGFNWNEREKTRNSAEYQVNLPGGTKSYADVPSGCLTSPTNVSFVSVPGTLGWDPNCVFGQYVLKENFHQDITNKDWKVDEKVTTSYIKFDVDTEVGGMPLRGNFGAQYIYVDQHSDAFAVANQDAVNGVAPVSDGTKYGDLLPDMNLVLEIPMQNYLRVAAGKEVVRPRLDQMRASTEYHLNTTPGSAFETTTCQNTDTGATILCRLEGTGGNPRLKPFTANAYDFSWEKYWETRAYVQATLWYKELQTYIYTQSLVRDYGNVPNPSDNLIPASTTGIYSAPANGTGGYMKGYELSASMPLDVLWAPLEGFGFQVAYADTTSSIQPNGPGTSSPFPGLSKYVSSATFYYERYGFSGRIAATHRSDFLGEVQAFGADQEFHNVQAETITDLQFGYAMQGPRFEGLTFLFQVQNVFNEPYREFYADRSQVRTYIDYGRRYLLGVTYKF